MKEKLQILKKWVATGEVKTAKGRQQDDLLTLIGQMEALTPPHFPCLDDEQKCNTQCSRCKFVEDALKKSHKHQE